MIRVTDENVQAVTFAISNYLIIFKKFLIAKWTSSEKAFLFHPDHYFEAEYFKIVRSVQTNGQVFRKTD